MVLTRNMLHLFDALPILLKAVKMHSSLLGHKKIGDLLNRINPLHHQYLFKILLDLHLGLTGSEVQIEVPFGGEEDGDVLLVVVD